MNINPRLKFIYFCFALNQLSIEFTTYLIILFNSYLLFIAK